MGQYYCGETRIHQSKPIQYSLNQTDSFGYIVSNAYSGQQGSGVRALLSLQCWAASFQLPMYIVEPYIERYSLSTRLKHDDITNPTKFSDYFNMDHFNNVSMQENLPPLVSWEIFIDDAPRNAIVALIHNDFGCKKYERAHFRVVKRKTPCFPEKWLHNQQLAEGGFCTVKVIKLWGCLSHPESIKKMYNVIFEGWRPESVTLIFRMWAANWDKLQNPDTEDQLTCKDVSGKKMQHKFHPSPRLVHEARYYTSAFLNSRNKVALMIRSEQAIRGFGAKTEDRLESLNTCMEKSVELAKTLLGSSEENSTSAGIFLTLDIGKYGSNSMEWVLGLDKYNLSSRSQDVITSVKNVVPLLYNGKWTFRDWENSFTQATDDIDNPGYIASLQRTIASQADCLVLLGGGDYQRLALHDYLENHPRQRQCLHFLCFTEGYQKQFTRVVDEYNE